MNSVDAFIEQSDVVIKDISDLTDALDDSKKKLNDLTGFWKVRDPKLKHIVIGMLLQILAVANGDISKLKVEIIDKEPFIKISLHGLSSKDCLEYIKAYEDFIERVWHAVANQIPRSLKAASELADKASFIKDNAKYEIEALDTVKKISAAAKTARIVVDAPKISAFI